MGFIRISRHYRSCILQINVRGIPVGNGASVELHAFYRDDDQIHVTSSQIASLNCFRKNISARLPVAESNFPEGRPLTQIDGFIIKPPSDRDTLFWMASALFFDIDISMMHPPVKKMPEQFLSGTKTSIHTDASNASVPIEVQAAENASAQQNAEPETAEPAETAAEPTETMTEPTEAAAEPTETSQDEIPAELSSDETSSEVLCDTTLSEAAPADTFPVISRDEPPAEDLSGGAPPEAPSARFARKIHREDLSLLPRKFWPLANNSFLLHGYRCYGHLLLAEEDGRMWLGVPGTYDSREARAADLFGFPRFTRAYASSIGLGPEERNDSGDFGHWCRCVGPK